MNVHNCGVPLLARPTPRGLKGADEKPGIAVLHKSRCFGVYAGLRRVAGRPFVYNYDISGWEAADELL